MLIAGAAYKPGVEDFRESPALQIIERLERYDVEIAYHDPLVPAIPLRHASCARSRRRSPRTTTS